MANEKEKKDKPDKKAKEPAKAKNEKQNEVVQQALKDLGLVKDASKLAKIPKVSAKANQSEDTKGAALVDGTKPKTRPAAATQSNITEGVKPTDSQPPKFPVRRRPAAAAAAGAPGQVATDPDPPRLEPYDDPGYFLQPRRPIWPRPCKRPRYEPVPHYLQDPGYPPYEEDEWYEDEPYYDDDEVYFDEYEEDDYFFDFDEQPDNVSGPKPASAQQIEQAERDMQNVKKEEPEQAPDLDVMIVDPPQEAADDILAPYLQQPDDELGEDIQPSLARLADELWDRAATNPDALKLKETYEKLPRAQNVNNLTKTDINGELKNMLPKSAAVRDMRQRAIQNAILRAANGLLLMLQETINQNQNRNVVDAGVNSLKALAYASSSINQQRRYLIRPHLAPQYQALCDRPTATSHQLLLGPNLAQSARESNETTRLVQGLSGRPSRRRGGRFGRGRFRRFRPGTYGYYRHFLAGMSKLNFFPQFCSQNTRNWQNYMYALDIEKYVDQQNSESDKNKIQAKVEMTQVQKQSVNMHDCVQDVQGNSNSSKACNNLHFRRPCSWTRCTARQTRETSRRPTTPAEPGRKLTSQVGEYDVSHINLFQTPFVAGGISRKLSEWKKLTRDTEILSLVKGIKLDFFQDPVQHKLPHEIKFNAQESKVVQAELEKFEALGVIKKSMWCPGDFVSNLFTRPKKDSSKLRILANLKILNQNVFYNHFKMDSLQSLLHIITPNMFLASVDLENSYYLLPIWQPHRKFLKCISFGQIWEFQALPQGYCDAPRIFTKLLKVPLTELRKQGFQNFAWIDDIILLATSPAELIRNIEATVNLLQSLGYCINVKKSEIKPVQVIKFIGFIIDTVKMSIGMTDERADKLIAHAQRLLATDTCSIRDFAGVIGQMVAAAPAVKYGPLHTKPLEISKIAGLKKAQGNFDGTMQISQFDKMDLQWWIDNVKYSEVSIVDHPPQAIIYTDASTDGYGLHYPEKNITVGNRWTAQESQRHINILELHAIDIGLKTFFSDSEVKYVKIFSDSQVAIAALRNQGSTKSLQCQQWTRRILLWCESRNIQLQLEYIHTSKNIFADRASRHFTNPDTEWCLQNNIFDYCCQFFQIQPEIDMFASRVTAKLPVYCSWHPDPYATHIDAFQCNWTLYDNLYCFPAFSCVS